MVEAVRTGYLVARVKKAATQWDARKGSTTKGATGKTLDQQVQAAAVATGRAVYMGTRRPGSQVRTERVN